MSISTAPPKELLEAQVGLEFVPVEYGGSFNYTVRKGLDLKKAWEKLGLTSTMTDPEFDDIKS